VNDYLKINKVKIMFSFKNKKQLSKTPHADRKEQKFDDMGLEFSEKSLYDNPISEISEKPSPGDIREDFSSFLLYSNITQNVRENLLSTYDRYCNPEPVMKKSADLQISKKMKELDNELEELMTTLSELDTFPLFSQDLEVACQLLMSGVSVTLESHKRT
jgi:hypothetical protein